MLERVVSGGQTGVDRAALDAALAVGLPIGGHCPLGRRAEDGRVPDRYALIETPSPKYAQRTEWNVRDSDGTLALTRGPATGGTAFTIEVARQLHRPLFVQDLRAALDAAAVADWLVRSAVRILNVAGPRESGAPGIHAEAFAFLRSVLSVAARPGR